MISYERTNIHVKRQIKTYEKCDLKFVHNSLWHSKLYGMAPLALNNYTVQNFKLYYISWKIQKKKKQEEEILRSSVGNGRT